jgi:hypothetical protein
MRPKLTILTSLMALVALMSSGCAGGAGSNAPGKVWTQGEHKAFYQREIQDEFVEVKPIDDSSVAVRLVPNGRYSNLEGEREFVLRVSETIYMLDDHHGGPEFMLLRVTDEGIVLKYETMSVMEEPTTIDTGTILIEFRDET